MHGMSELLNYGICSAQMPSSSVARPPVDRFRCAVEMRAREFQLATEEAAAAAANAQQSSGGLDAAPSRLQPSILYSLLNGNDGDAADDDATAATRLSRLSCVDAGSYRTRSDSFGSFGGRPIPAARVNSSSSSSSSMLSRTPSGGSLAMQGGAESNGGRQSDELVEATVRRLLQLYTDGGDAAAAAAAFDESRNRSRSHPGTPPTSGGFQFPEPRRKYSMGSRLTQLHPTITESVPVDLSCKRTRYGDDERRRSPEMMDVQVDDDVDDHPGHSILKSILSASTSGSSRPRSHTLSVCGARGLARDVAVGVRRLPAGPRRSSVTLAKKTVFPVSGRVAERLRKAVEFARSLPAPAEAS